MFHATCRDVLLLGLLLPGPPTVADTVKLDGRPAFRHVQVSDFRGQRLVFRGVSKQYLRKPLAQVEWIRLEACPPVGVAEQAAADGRWNLAIAAYHQALAQAEKPWLKDLIRFRLLAVCDHAGRFAEAVGLYAELLEQKGAGAEPAAPRHPGPPGSAGNAQAMARLTRTLATAESTLAKNRLQVLLLELRLYEGLDSSPEHAAVTTAPAAGPDRSPILGLPTPVAKPRAVWLPGDSFLLSAAQSALDAGDSGRAVELLERALPHVKAADREPWRLMLGRALVAAGRPADAAADLLNLAETAGDSAVSAAALYYVGLAHERLEQPEIAAQLYREVLGREEAPAEVRREAADALRRLGE